MVGELLAGAILGPQLLDLVHSSEVMDAMAELGVIMLLFMAGLETHMAELMETRVAAVKVAVLGAALPFVGGLLVGLLFGWGSGSALFMATALTATSVGITVRALRELGHSERRAVRIILAAAVLDDVLGLIVLVVVSGTTSGSIDAWNLALLIVEAIAYVGLIGFFGPRLVIRLRDWLKDLNVSILFEIGVILTLALSLLADYIGLAAIVGAFIAGLTMSELNSTPTSRDASSRWRGSSRRSSSSSWVPISTSARSPSRRSCSPWPCSRRWPWPPSTWADGSVRGAKALRWRARSAWA